MQGYPPSSDEWVNPQNWEDDRFARWGQLNTQRLFPTARVFRGSGPFFPFERHPRAIDRLEFLDPNGETMTIEQMMVETETDGFLVLHQGVIVFDPAIGWLNLIQVLRVGIYHDEMHYEQIRGLLN
jgi:hypothetical protein